MKGREWLKKVTGYWSSLSPARRSALAVVISAGLVAMGFFLYWLVKPSYVPLFTKLDQRDAAAVVEKLKEMKIPYRLANEGSTILVPKDKVYETRLTLAGAGVLKSQGLGFELFDQNKLGMTDFERRINYQRALQEELRRTILSLEEVEDARVHLVLPQPSVFVQERQPPSAAVVLKLKPLAKLEPTQVQGIMQLVAASVEGLKPENVHIIDTEGRVLSAGLAEGSQLPIGAQQQRQQELERAVERDLEQRITRLLTSILGPGQAVAMVNVELDFNQQEITRREWGKQGALRSEQVKNEQGTGTQASGPVGDMNREVPGYAAVTPGSSNYNKSETTRNYELDETQTRIVYAPGQIKRISASVAVNGPLDAQKEEQIRQIVASAVGYQPARGDQITVLSLAFDDTLRRKAEAEMAAAEEAARRRQKLQLYFALAGAGVSLILLLLFLLLRRRRAVPAVEAWPEAQVPGKSLPVEGVKPEEALAEVAVSEEERRKEQERRARQERLREIVRQHPEDVAQLIKAWLSEE
ncbi:flagellar M-ring protein FliF [Thermanaeromonas toyohensis ToBE]|uniref:Flagellar M-ring protein n=1 Tax=Thermanaeromonas toyohensis ToBE TaxID=698762 RepID=A0A1W1VKY0_9FIRM|nr:flagellar basal-body MS-ring/collar protein FliF [Thermanaeromonas toyohensis]SMB93978.1 flagellar M-ring protein FliF [Thermanaeromonas toyohensis ToBE]